jgi:hypothetical protein
MSTFLTEDEIAILTGRKRKTVQIAVLRKMGVAFFVNGTGRPIVTRSVIEGRPGETTKQPEQRKAWTPRVIGA